MGLETDFFTRSLDTRRHPAYDALVDKVMSAITDPKQMATYSTPEQIAEVVYEAATDRKINSAMSLAQMQKQLMPCVYRWETRLFARPSINNSSDNSESLLRRAALGAHSATRRARGTIDNGKTFRHVMECLMFVGADDGRPVPFDGNEWRPNRLRKLSTRKENPIRKPQVPTNAPVSWIEPVCYGVEKSRSMFAVKILGMKIEKRLLSAKM